MRKLIFSAAALALIGPRPSQAQPAPKFEVVSVKPCRSETAGRGGGGGPQSPGRLTLNCATVASLIRQAFVEYAGGHRNAFATQRIEGPAWIESETYEIDATTEGAPGQAMMRGPMLQALLADRFGLLIRRRNQDVPVYALTVAKSGLKLQRAAEGSCVPLDYSLPTPYPQFCGMPKRGGSGLYLVGATMADLCRILSTPEISDRPVVDRTGLSGMFDVPLPGPAALHGPSADPVAADSASPFDTTREALQKLGLNLERARGSDEILVIDRIQRPTGN